MAILLTNFRRFLTPNQSVIWNGQTQASIAWRYRYETSGGLTAGVLNNAFFFSRGLGSVFGTTAFSTTAGRLLVKLTAQASVSFTIIPGIVYTFVLTFNAGVVTLYANGIQVGQATSALTATQTSGNPFVVGAQPAGSPYVFSIEDIWSWNGYVATAADAVLLRDQLPGYDTIGQGTATSIQHWTLSGITGNTVALGDAGLANATGDHTLDLSAAPLGTGSAIYTDPLVFVPSITATPYVSTCGKLIGFEVNATGSGQPISANAMTTMPVMSLNGTVIGPLERPYVTGYTTRVLAAVPFGTQVHPGDTVSLTAPTGWLNSPIGIAAALDGSAIDNRTNRSAVGTDQLVKTFKPGWNNAHLATTDGSTYQVAKNWLTRLVLFDNIATKTADGKPLTLTNSPSSATFINYGPTSGLDSTVVPPIPGLWAVGWDDLDTSHPTTFALATFSPTMLTVTERTDLANPGVRGIGQVRVFNVQPLSTTAAANSRLVVQLSCPSRLPNFDKLVVYQPGDFTFVAGQPVTLDKTDPLAPCFTYVDRNKNGVGSMRFVDSCWKFGGQSNISEPEQVWKMTDFTWNQSGGKSNNSWFASSVRPWDPAVTPYIYTTLFGDPFPATLAVAIPDTTTTVLTISDASTAPCIVGLRLRLPTGEKCRILAINGNQVTVERGSCSTTAAPCPSGPILVENRWLPAGGLPGLVSGGYFEIVGATQHLYNTMQVIPATGNWPIITLSDGKTSNLKGYGVPIFVTGQNTILGYLASDEIPPVTITTTYALDATCKMATNYPDSPGIPVEFSAKTTGSFPAANLHVNVPHAASDSLVDYIFDQVRNNFPAGRTIYVEYTNEPWNFFFVEFTPLKVISWWLNPPSMLGREWYVQRATQIAARARNRLNVTGRGGEIQLILNNQIGDVNTMLAELNYARTTLGVNVDGICTAGYLWPEDTAVTSTAFWQYDDEQAADLFTIDLYFNTSGNSRAGKMANMVAALATYNATNGTSVFIYGYEGGISRMCPTWDTTLAADIDAVTTTIPVASAAGLAVGTPILIGTRAPNGNPQLPGEAGVEWAMIGGISGNTLTVTRGINGTTAASKTSGFTVRSAYLERSRDVMYNSMTYYAEQDWYGWLQTHGFRAFNQYALSIGIADGLSYYGPYHAQQEDHGRGDGSDGKADNRRCLFTPGKTFTKAANVSQDITNVSVKGQAFLDWMGGNSPNPSRKGVSRLPSPQKRSGR